MKTIAHKNALVIVKAMGLCEAIMTARAIRLDCYSPDDRLAAIHTITNSTKQPRYCAQAFVDKFYAY
jgi:hypothetical protein